MPIEESIYERFEKELGEPIRASSERAEALLKDFPIDSVCGDYCVGVIEMTRDMLKKRYSGAPLQPESRREIIATATKLVLVCCFG